MSDKTYGHMKFDVKNRLNEYIPALFELIPEKGFDWKKIERVFNKKYIELNKRFETEGEPFQIKASFYGIITQAIQGNVLALRIFDFVNKLFEELADNLNENERLLIKDNVFHVLVSQDEKYLNYIGELAALNKVIKTGNYRLLNVEQKLDADNPNSSNIDFTLFDEQAKSEHRVEIVNVHLDETNTLSEANIERLLDQKLRNKVLKKAKGSKSSFLLVPIIWGSHEFIRKILAYYEDTDFSLANVSIPCCFVPFSDSEGNMVARFGTIDTIFDHTE